MKKLSFLPTLILILLGLVACTKGTDCFVADSIKEIKVSNLNNKGYYLFLRTSGFQDKAHFYELFTEAPEFDVCGRNQAQPVFQILLDESEGFPVKLMISNRNMKLVYSSTNDKIVDLESIDIEVLEPLNITSALGG